MKLKIEFFNSKKDFWPRLSKVIFRISFITFVILFAVEYFLPGFVANWFNPIWLLIIALISGIIQIQISE